LFHAFNDVVALLLGYQVILVKRLAAIRAPESIVEAVDVYLEVATTVVATARTADEAVIMW
jgi:hypothetical protein